MPVKFHFYATLLDSFGWYKRNEKDGAKQEFLDRINRVKTPPTDPMLRGIAFEDAVNHFSKTGTLPDGPVKVHDKQVEPSLIEKFTKGFKDSARQVFVETVLQTLHGDVRVYGFADDILAGTIYDTKTTGNYEFPKYLGGWQHPSYLEALKGEAGRFVYRITDFDDYFEEEYFHRKDDTDRLISECCELVEFVEANRSAITDRKIFGLR